MCKKMLFLVSFVLLLCAAGSACADDFATDPDPPNNDWCVPTDQTLSWTPGDGAVSHDVYFGIDFNDVNDADTSSSAYKDRVGVENYDPGPLQEATTYYWRIDAVGAETVKGDVWSFTTDSALCLKVDLGLPTCESTPNDVTTVPGTVKEGWWGRVFWGDTDMYYHDFAWEDGSRAADPPNTPGIDGSGVHFALDSDFGGGGYHVHGMCRDNLGGCCCPTGSPVGEPIANGWFHNIDNGGECRGDIHMRMTGLPPGRYGLKSYHNHWEPCTQATRNCLDCYSNMPPMTGVYATSLPVAGLPGCGVVWSGTGTGVTSLVEAYNIDVTSVLTDADVATSTIEFETDGSDVLVVYDGGDNTYPDPARTDREGSKGILNAFVLQLVTTLHAAYSPTPRNGAENVAPDVVLSWKAGETAAWHDVYFGTDFSGVSEADTSSSLHKGRQEVSDTNYALPEPLAYEQTYYWRIDEVNDPNLLKGDVWSFAIYRAKASNPSPANGAGDLPRDVSLSWSPGFVAASHDVYFGTDFDNVSDGNKSFPEYKGSRPIEADTYEPSGLLDLGTTHYWRIDEVNNPFTWKGNVWRFTVTDHIVVDDMESYNTSDNMIGDTWLGGGYYNWTGAWLHLWVDPCEPVHAGRQSMKYDYDSSGGWWGDLHYYSEVARTFAAPCDWSVSGIKVLTLYFYGDPDNDANAGEQAYVGLQDSNGPDSYAEVRYGHYGEDMNNIKSAEWRQWNIALSDFNDVNLACVEKVYIGFGDRGNLNPGGTPGGSGTVYFDDIRLYSRKCAPEFASVADLSGNCIVDSEDFAILGSQWLQSPGSPSADIAEPLDGFVNWKDLAMLVDSWLQEQLWPE